MEKYRGIVAYTTDRALRENAVQDANGMDMRESAGAAREEEDEQDVEEVQILQESGSFSEILVWGHEAEAEDENDPYLKGMQEWISFAETVWIIQTLLGSLSC
ncbi:MAG: hypothetical protein M1819_001249 [Sarea resinae]|nr:MAG: hypothetical protein M1819_001249 [Sarea resinae]